MTCWRHAQGAEIQVLQWPRRCTPCLFTLGTVHSCLLCSTRDVTQGCAGGETGDAQRCGTPRTRRTARRGLGGVCVQMQNVGKKECFGKPRRRRFFSGVMAENVPVATVCHARELQPSYRLPLLQSAAHLHLSVSSTGDGHGLCVVVFVCFCMFLFLPYQHFMNPVSCFIWRRFQLDQPVPVTVSCSMRCPFFFF